jgi:hypothetical protein
MNTTRRTATAALAVGLFAAGSVLTPFIETVQAQPIVTQTYLRLNFNTGDVIPVTLNDKISSKDSHNGDTFTATVDSDKPGYRRLSGDTITGHVTDVHKSRHNKPGTISVEFDKLTTQDGKTYNIDGSPIGLDDNSVKTNDDGTFVAKSTEKKKTLQYAGIGAGAGAILGILGGGGIRLGTILLGGALGAGAGELSKGKKQSHDVYLDPGTKLGVQLDSPFDYPNY